MRAWRPARRPVRRHALCDVAMLILLVGQQKDPLEFLFSINVNVKIITQKLQV